jgi:hypothetical protein
MLQTKLPQFINKQIQKYLNLMIRPWELIHLETQWTMNWCLQAIARINRSTWFVATHYLIILPFFGLNESLPHVNSQFNHKEREFNMKVYTQEERVYSLVPFLNQNP